MKYQLTNTFNKQAHIGHDLSNLDIFDSNNNEVYKNIYLF